MEYVKKMGLVCSILVAIAVGWAPLANAAVEVEGDAYVGVFDKYLWRGFNLSGSEPVAQGGVDLSAGGFTLSFWSNAQLANDEDGGLKSGEVNETDIILDYSFDLNESVWVSVGNMFYSLSDLEDTNEAYLSVGVNTILNPSLTVYWDWDKSEADGLFYVVSIGHDVNLTEALSLSMSASAGYNQENYSVNESYSDWQNAEFGLTFNYVVGEQFSLSPSFVYSTPISDEAEDSSGIDDETSVGITAVFTF